MKKPHSYDKWIGQRIRDLRIERGIIQRDLAKRIGVQFQQLQKYENGTNRISFSRLMLVCEALKVSIYEMLDGFNTSKKVAATPPKLRVIVRLASQMTPKTREAYARVGHAMRDLK